MASAGLQNLETFVREALTRGSTKPDRIKCALRLFADVPFPIPIPKP